MGLLRFFRRAPADPSAWHECPAPLFKTITLEDGSSPAISDTIMRRKLNDTWQYRALTDDEFMELQRREQW